jgi:hypothetical protein
MVREETTIATSKHTVVCVRRPPEPMQSTAIPEAILARLRGSLG